MRVEATTFAGKEDDGRVAREPLAIPTGSVPLPPLDLPPNVVQFPRQLGDRIADSGDSLLNSGHPFSVGQRGVSGEVVSSDPYEENLRGRERTRYLRGVVTVCHRATLSRFAGWVKRSTCLSVAAAVRAATLAHDAQVKLKLARL